MDRALVSVLERPQDPDTLLGVLRSDSAPNPGGDCDAGC